MKIIESGMLDKHEEVEYLYVFQAPHSWGFLFVGGCVDLTIKEVKL